MRTSPRRRLFLAFVTAVALAAGGGPATAEEKQRRVPLPDLGRAHWIWDAPTAAGGEAAETCYLRRALDLPAKPEAASVLITADNGYELYVNGSIVGGDSGYNAVYWQSVERYDIAHLLSKGRNVLAVRGLNLGGPGGLLAAARIDLPGGRTVRLATDATWRAATSPQTGWSSPEFDASAWSPAAALGAAGMKPWGPVSYPEPVSPGVSGRRTAGRLAEPDANFPWPAGVVFLAGRLPESSARSPQCAWRIAGSRAYREFDTLGPSVLGRRLMALAPAGPEAEPRVLLDAGGGVIGSPTVTYDGRRVLFSMAREGEAFHHVYATGAGGGRPRQLTDGPFHDFDPAELPDGRIVFSSTRIGTREEYHGNLARSLFTMDANGGDIRPLTHHIVGDNEPRVTAEGLIAFIRCDNFLERAKVETQIHLVHPDGTAGVALMGADRYAIAYHRGPAAEGNAAWLRQFGYGSPAPLPDGRVACLSTHGLVVSRGGIDPPRQITPAVQLFDIAPLPDGRLLCTAAGRSAIAVLDLHTGGVTRLLRSDTVAVHSPAYLGPRPKPGGIAPSMTPPPAPPSPEAGEPTGEIVCRNVFRTKQTAADVDRIAAVRIYEGRPLALRSAKHPYCHIGVRAIELGTVPLAADGSFYAEVPADRALAIQAVDAEGRAVINELSWIYVRPGERRSCVGCHSPRQAAPATDKPVLATTAPPVRALGRGRPHEFRGNNAANGGVLNLQLDRFREAAAIGPEAATGELLDRLAAGDEAARVSAARLLALRRDAAAAEALEQALEDPAAPARMNAALALASCGRRASVPPLIAALTDASPPVAQAAAVALRGLTGRRGAFDATAPRARRGDAADAWRAWLEREGWAGVEAALVERLQAGRAGERIDAAAALGRIGGKAAAEALRRRVAADDGGDLRLAMAAMRSLGHLGDAGAVELLAGVLAGNLGGVRSKGKGFHELGHWQRDVYLAATAAEAMGRIGGAEAEAALVAAFGKLAGFWHYSRRTGDHAWLMGCHSSVLHFRILEALDRMESAAVRPLAPHALRSVPIDPDRGLLLRRDGYERLVARVVRRGERAANVVDACLAALGDANAPPGWPALRQAVAATPPAVSVKPPSPEARAAQLLSVVAEDPADAPRLLAALDRYRRTPPGRKRSWVCFYLARALGRLGGRPAADALIDMLAAGQPEASFGRPDPPNVFVHDAMTPCCRAAAAFALGRLGDRRAVPALLAAVGNLDNAVDVRHSSARALAMLARPADLPALRPLAEAYPEVATRRVLARACRRASRPRPGLNN